MRIFLDSSALAKRYIQESGTQQVNDLFIQVDEIFVSLVALPEVISAMTRNKTEKKMTLEQFNERKNQLILDFQDFNVCDLTPQVIKRTLYFIENYFLRTLDAIHLASAMEIKIELFVSADTRQLKAAQAVKMKVLSV